MLCRKSGFLVSRNIFSKCFLRKASNVAQDGLKPIEQFTQRLINAASTGDTSYMHRDAGKIWSAIPQANNQTIMPPTIEKAQFLAQNRTSLIPDEDGINDSIEPGTFVELRRNRIVTHGIVLYLQVLEARRHSFTLTYTGEVWPHLISDITYMVPNFVSRDLLERAGDGYKALNTAQTAARLQIVEQIRTFTRQHERHFNSISKDIHPLYEKIRHQDPDKWLEVTTPAIAKHLDVRSPPPVLTLFAMHAHLMGLPLYYIADPRNHKTSHKFSVRPLSHVQNILQVNSWVRTNDPMFQQFVGTARHVIQKSREVQKDSWSAPPSVLDTKLDDWSPSDLTFIRYFQNALRTTRSLQEDPYDRASPVIIKAIDMYKGYSFTPGMSQLLLTELGVLAPWDDVVTRAPELYLDIAPQGQSREAQTMDELVHHILKKPDVPAPPVLRHKLRDIQFSGSLELLKKDPNEAHRHDFGDLPVYIVDDASAQELDDGLSIEAITGEPGKYWVHVHVADPTAQIPPGHILDVQARKLVSTVYSSHRTWSMIPPAITMSLFSLGAKSQDNGQKVLTFSLKMSKSGEFLDYTVRAAIVRNTHIMTYAQVDQLLGLKSSFYTRPLEETPADPVDPIPDTHRSNLQTLRDIGYIYFRRTIETGSIFNFTFPLAKVQFREALPASPILSPRPILRKGFPAMTYVVENHYKVATSFRATVAEFMKVAGRAASRFCRDQGIPAIRRASLQLQGNTAAETEYLCSIRNESGYIDPYEGIKHNVFAPPGELTLSPRGHWNLGVPDGEGYCRVTSPLRRYGDLLMHWQIKHALIPGNTRPLFSAEYLKPLLFKLFDKEKVTATAEKHYNKHWALSYLARHIHIQQQKHGRNYNPLPNLIARTTGVPGYDTMNATNQVSVIIPSLAVHGELKGIESCTTLPIGTSIKVKIKEFKMGIPLVLHLEQA